MIGGLGIGSGQPRISNLTSYDKWTVEEHKSTKIKQKAKVVVRPVGIEIEIHDNGNHYLILSVSGKPKGLGIQNILASLAPFSNKRSVAVNNGIWSCLVEK